MSVHQYTKVHWSFWLIVVFSLLWNAMSCMNFLWQTMNMTPEVLATLNDAQKAILSNRPFWNTAAFGIAAAAGFAGSVLMLIKRSASFYLFVLAFVATIITMIPVIGLMRSGVMFTNFDIAMYVVATPLLALFLVWYAKYCTGKGWLR